MRIADRARRCWCPLLLVFAACAGDGAFARHFDGEPWGNGLAAQFDSTGRVVAGSALLVTAGALAFLDHRWQEEATENQAITEGSTNNGDGTAVGLTVIALGMGVGRWIDGDSAHDLEVLGESFLVTEGLTEGLKVVVGRQRPSKADHRSFPSGHTSYSFAMATFVERWLGDHATGWLRDLRWFAYAPAAYVAIDRVEANRHWPSDVAFGTFLGWFVTNVVYDAHYGAPGRPGIFGVRGLGIEPAATTEGGAGVAMVLRF